MVIACPIACELYHQGQLVEHLFDDESKLVCFVCFNKRAPGLNYVPFERFIVAILANSLICCSLAAISSTKGFNSDSKLLIENPTFVFPKYRVNN